MPYQSGRRHSRRALSIKGNYRHFRCGGDDQARRAENTRRRQLVRRGASGLLGIVLDPLNAVTKR